MSLTQKRNNVIFVWTPWTGKLNTGIELHSNNHVVVVSDEDGRQEYRKRLSNDLDKTLSSLAPYQSEIEGVAVEPTYN